MQVSVIICAYAEDLYDDLVEAAESVYDQSYDPVELVIVVDGTESLYERARETFGNREDTVLYCNDENQGLAASRNQGVNLASGDIVAFMDDDALADDRWVEHLVSAYEDSQDRLAVGGKMVPKWVAERPDFLPAEFYWLIGVTHRGFPETESEVRNTNGSNLSFRREVFVELGGFDTSLGLEGEGQLQAEEPELCTRLQTHYGQGVWYTPEATVAHKIFSYRTDPVWLAKRAFWQGYSKRGMEVMLPTAGQEEHEFLGQLLFSYIPSRVRSLLTAPSVEKLNQLVTLVCLLGLVGFGYLYGVVKWARVSEQ